MFILKLTLSTRPLQWQWQSIAPCVPLCQRGSSKGSSRLKTRRCATKYGTAGRFVRNSFRFSSLGIYLGKRQTQAPDTKMTSSVWQRTSFAPAKKHTVPPTILLWWTVLAQSERRGELSSSRNYSPCSKECTRTLNLRPLEKALVTPTRPSVRCSYGKHSISRWSPL